MEEIKNNYTNPLGKKIVLDSCKAVVLDNKSVEEAVNMFKSDRKDNRLIDNDDDNIHSYEKYGGYNDFDDDTIDDAFEGYPELTWNVD